MVQVSVKYTGDLHCDATHGPSQAKLSTDAPSDNMGKGEAFSPTDLVATALATCIATTMGIVAQRKGFTLPPCRVRVEKHISADAPRRVVRLPVTVWLPLPSNHPERELL